MLAYLPFNLFLHNELSDDLSAFVNFEFTNSYSSARGWGNFNLEEAWIQYRKNSKFNLKGGLLIPVFNNLNEVKNRMPYLLYITRPLVYEASIAELLPLEDYLPERAFLQADGTLEAGSIEFDYAAYVGNSETGYINASSQTTVQTGIDTTEFLLIGGRVGIRFEALKAGVSATKDKDNQNAIGLGDVNRTRIGLDASMALHGVFAEGEYIQVTNGIEIPGTSFDKSFYYATLGYDFDDQTFAYATYSVITDDAIPELSNGLTGLFFGTGYRPSESIVIKVQYADVRISDGTVPPAGVVPVPLNLNLEVKSVSAAVSVSF